MLPLAKHVVSTPGLSHKHKRRILKALDRELPKQQRDSAWEVETNLSGALTWSRTGRPLYWHFWFEVLYTLRDVHGRPQVSDFHRYRSFHEINTTLRKNLIEENAKFNVVTTTTDILV